MIIQTNNMKKISLSLFTLALCFSGLAQQPATEVATIEVISNELSKLIKKDAKVEVVAEGFQFTEGPHWFDKEKMLFVL